MPRPTRRAFSILLGALVLFGVGTNAQAGWLYVIGSGMVGVVIAGFLLPIMAARALRFSRRVQPFCRVGDPACVVVSAHNDSRAARGPVVGTDRFLGDSSFVFPKVGGRSEAAFEYQVLPPRRGVFAAGVVQVRSGGPFGIAHVKRAFEVSSPTIVHPRWVPIPNFPLLEAASAPLESLHERPRRGAGMEFYGLREYRSGDSLRHVHWPSSARGSRLLVREFEEHLASRMTVIIDNSAVVGSEPVTTFEDSTAVAASIALYALEAGHPVQMSCGYDLIFEPDQQQTLDWLATIEPRRPRPLRESAVEVEIYRRSTAVVIFPSTKANASEAEAAVNVMQERSARVIAVVLSANTYEARSGCDESRLFDALRAARAIVYRVGKEESLQECLRTPCIV